MRFPGILIIILSAILIYGCSKDDVEIQDTVRILTIGNSFSEDAVEQNLHEIGLKDGHMLIIGNMYIGGCSLETHVKNARGNNADYSYRKIGTNGTKKSADWVTLEEAHSDEPWDFISLQQASPLSGQYDSFAKWLPELYDYVQERIKPEAEIILHQTWAYATDYDNSAFTAYDYDQMKMYESIVDAYNRAAELVGISIIIPCGTAIQNARTSFIGDNMNRDGRHLEFTYGRFTAACTWYEKLFGGIMANSYRPKGLKDKYIKVAHQSAYYAVKNPDGVTQIDVNPE